MTGADLFCPPSDIPDAQSLLFNLSSLIVKYPGPDGLYIFYIYAFDCLIKLRNNNNPRRILKA